MFVHIDLMSKFDKDIDLKLSISNHSYKTLTHLINQYKVDVNCIQENNYVCALVYILI